MPNPDFITVLMVTVGFALSAFGWGAALCGRRLDQDLPEYAIVRFVAGLGMVYGLCVAMSLVGWMSRNRPVA